MQFEMLKEKSSIIKVIGVGGGGGNAVNHMYRQGITGVDFIICNTDAQALELSPIPNKVQLGASLTEGMGAGSIPEVGKNSAIENIDDIKQMLGSNTKMLFITAGMGGGTGTGASPIIAKAAKELDILTVAIVTTPFSFEGKRRKMQAEDGLEEIKKYVDSYLVISNDRLREIFGNLTLGSAFGQADDILTTAAKGIAEIITIPGYINVDFKDVRTVMKDSGVSIMGSSAAEGDNRAIKAVEGALSSPLLEDNEIEGARYILLNITSGSKEVTMDEVSIITDYIQQEAGLSADLIWGNCTDESLGEKLAVTIIATGFQTSEERQVERGQSRKVAVLSEETPLVKPVEKVNTFIEEKAEEAFDLEEPVLKTSVLDLFAGVEAIPAPQAEVEQLASFGEPAFFAAEQEQSTAVETLEETSTFASPFDFELKVEEPEALSSPEPEFDFGVSAPADEQEFVFETQLETAAAAEFSFEVPAELETPAAAFSFETETETESTAEVPLMEVPAEIHIQAETPQTEDAVEEQLRKSRERIMRLKDLSMKLRTANGLQELENEPAYKRKQMSLDQVPHSSESQVSRFTLSNEEGITEIRPNNSFLHDNVD